MGVDFEARRQARALRVANEDLSVLRDTQMAQAALEERARLAREIHDGLAQDLWFAKLKQGRLLQQPHLSTEVRQLATDVSGAIDAALAEARQAVMTMRSSDSGAAPFPDVLSRYVADFGDRYGLRMDFSAETTLPDLSARTQAELLRILQEALTNVRKHADATVVRVRADARDGRFTLSVADNGRGFDPAEVNGQSFGLHSMRERAALAGGSLAVESEPLDGARITVAIPLVAVQPTVDRR